MKLSLRSRLTLWYTFILVIVLSVSGAGVVWMEGRLSLRRLDRELSDIEETMRKIVANELHERVPAAEAAAEAAETVGDGTLTTAVLDANGVVLTSNMGGLDPSAI